MSSNKSHFANCQLYRRNCHSLSIKERYLAECFLKKRLMNLKTAVKHIPSNKNQHKIDKDFKLCFVFSSRNLLNLRGLRPPHSDIFSLLHLKFDTSIAKGLTAAQLHSTRQKMHRPGYRPLSHKTPDRGYWCKRLARPSIPNFSRVI